MHPQHLVVRVAVVDHQRLVEPLGQVDVPAEATRPAPPGPPRRCGSGRARSRRPRGPCRVLAASRSISASAASSSPARRAGAPRWGAARRRRPGRRASPAASTAQRAPGRSQPICTIRVTSDRGGRGDRVLGGEPVVALARRRCRGGSGCRRPGAAAARAPAGGRGRGGCRTSPRSPRGARVGRSLTASSVGVGARRRRPRAWGRRPARDLEDRVLAGQPAGPRARRRRRATSAGSAATSARASAPATTSVTSPRTPSAAQAASSASGPRRTSSWVLVSSRQTAAGAVVAERLGHRGQRRLGAVRRLEEHHRPLLGGQVRRAGGPLARLARQEALEAEPVHRQPGHGQRGEHRGGPGHGGDGDVRPRPPRRPAGSRGRRRSACPRRSPAAPARRRAAPRAAAGCAPARCPRSRTPPGR